MLLGVLADKHPSSLSLTSACGSHALHSRSGRDRKLQPLSRMANVLSLLQNLELDQDENVDARSHHVSVILVRTCEKLLDAAHGRQDADVVFAGETLGQAQALDALRDALPALHDLATRTLPDAEIYR